MTASTKLSKEQAGADHKLKAPDTTPAGNVATAGAAGGAAAGTAAGALVGGPIGAAVEAAVGGVAGAMAGGLVDRPHQDAYWHAHLRELPPGAGGRV